MALFQRIQFLYLWAIFSKNFRLLRTCVTTKLYFKLLITLINKETVKLGPKICSLEVQMGVTFEYKDLGKIWDTGLKFNLSSILCKS